MLFNKQVLLLSGTFEIGNCQSKSNFTLTFVIQVFFFVLLKTPKGLLNTTARLSTNGTPWFLRQHKS